MKQIRYFLPVALAILKASRVLIGGLNLKDFVCGRSNKRYDGPDRIIFFVSFDKSIKPRSLRGAAIHIIIFLSGNFVLCFKFL